MDFVRISFSAIDSYSVDVKYQTSSSSSSEYIKSPSSDLDII